jgi:hypothetical protein
VAGDVVDVAAPPVAVTPVSDGMEKYVFAHAAGAADVMLASLVRVTTSGLLDAPFAPTVRADARVCELPIEEVAKLHRTSLVVEEHPVWAALSALLEKPPAKVVLVGS